MGNAAVKTSFTGTVNFRAPAKMVADIMDYQRARKLEKPAAAQRELMEVGIEMCAAYAEAKAHGLDPAQALRTAIAQKISNL